MNRIFFAAIVFFTLAILFTACKKGTGTTTIPAGMTVKINNVSWAATTFYFMIDTSVPGQPFLRIIGLSGSDTTGTVIVLGIDNFFGKTGSSSLSDSLNGAEYDDLSLNAYHLATTGTVTITKYAANNVQGKFNFVADNFSFTSGQFNVPLY